MRRAFWALVHKMPCPVQHLLCDLCREYGCDTCLIDAFAKAGKVELSVGPPRTRTWRCDHATVSGSFAAPPSLWCGCTMQRVPRNIMVGSGVTVTTNGLGRVG